MSDSTTDPWAESTLFDQEELLDHVFEVESWQFQSLEVSTYCIKPGMGTLDDAAFIQFLGRKYPYFVFPEDEVDDYDFPYREAQRRADFDEDSKYDGKLGELVLFVLVDALLDLPLVSHKIGLMQEPVQDQKGADALFYGLYDGNEALGVGEAKIYTRKSQGIDSAFESTDRFHGAQGDAKTRHELRVARNNLSANLDEDQFKRLLDVFSPGKSQHLHVHPIFLGYQADWLTEKQKECNSPQELEEEIVTEIKDSEIQKDVQESLSEDYPNLEKYETVFMLFPLEDVDEFRERLQEEIFPHSVNH
ncbi:DUF1837 family protein (plasmid) [Halobacterium hubeiense]|uniref:DUF1837 family protein n=1 Tax=Halobacterium hubeiense TaxID=1407499 RepID=A0A0U5H6S0_9EURY|nr:Hachiman antiphage defense system protein HamA [Halobacterium hubeiense]CQH63559.1 DUF1837 family protein [Halobacterium hubeiense]